MAAPDLSPVALFEAAGVVGKAVVILLLLTSIWSWVTILSSAWSLRSLNAELKRFAKGGRSRLLDEVVTHGREVSDIVMEGESTSDRFNRISQSMLAVSSQVIAKRAGRVTDLAIIANIAPFIGLFGTVWGIMISFSAIAGANDTNLSTVAPGLAEALAATAYGLAVAIPASLGYGLIAKGFSRSAGQFRSQILLKAMEVGKEVKPT